MDRGFPLAMRAVFCAGIMSAAGAAMAYQDDALGVYGAFGNNMHNNGSTDAPSIGAIVPWAGWTPWDRGAGTSWYFDLFLSQWRAEPLSGASGSNTLAQLGAAAIWRHRFGEGSSPWFVEAGLGLTRTNRLYTTNDKTFSTRFNFVSQLGLGRSFGSDGRHEVSVRFQHYSNAGIRKPNPGEDFVQLRYGYRF